MSKVLIPDRFAIRDSGAATFYSLTDGHAIVTLNTLKTSSIETSGETVYARGGFGNAKLVGFSSDREAKLNLEDAIFDAKAIAMLTGNEMKNGKKIVDINEVQEVISNKITLNHTPVGALISAYEVKPNGVNGREFTLGAPDVNEDEYSVEGKEVTLNTAIKNGTNIRVYYQAETDEQAKTMKVTSDAFGGTFRVTLDVLVRDEFTKKDFAGQIRIPNAKVEDDFEISLSADGDPAVLTMPLEILKSPINTDMWELVIYDKDVIL